MCYWSRVLKFVKSKVDIEEEKKVKFKKAKTSEFTAIAVFIIFNCIS